MYGFAGCHFNVFLWILAKIGFVLLAKQMLVLCVQYLALYITTLVSLKRGWSLELFMLCNSSVHEVLVRSSCVCVGGGGCMCV